MYGVQGAVAAGMTAYGYAGGLTPADRLVAGGAVVFERMHDLVDDLTRSGSRPASPARRCG